MPPSLSTISTARCVLHRSVGRDTEPDAHGTERQNQRPQRKSNASALEELRHVRHSNKPPRSNSRPPVERCFQERLVRLRGESLARTPDVSGGRESLVFRPI